MITYLETGEAPDVMPSPFAVPAHPIALAAIARLPEPFLREGKMFGVLVVRDRDGRVGFCKAFSGMLEGSWHREGFVGPAFDEAARDAFWPAGEAGLGVLAEEQRRLDEDPVHRVYAEMMARQGNELAEMKRVHVERKALRKVARQGQTPTATHLLDQQSRADTAERRTLELAHAEEQGPIEARVDELTSRSKALAAERAARSRELLVRIQDTYTFANARGEKRTLRELFAPDSPPGGAGDCAAPKLLAYAFRNGMTPLALAEVWLGPDSPSGDRRTGVAYAACRGKCGPILTHMLDGTAEPAPIFGDASTIAPDEPRVVFEDRWLVVVAKPIGLLSVPGRSGQLTDSVETRLRSRHGAAHIVHRLDLDVSGLMLVAKDEATHQILQKAFARRQIDKRYTAILERAPAEARGTIELALRVDLDDRPRQIVDAAHGKLAVTDYEVIEGTRVALYPRTGRTHQLRVHCAVALSPIVGDRLYGATAARLMLHAEQLAFLHPHAGTRLCFELPAPF